METKLLKIIRSNFNVYCWSVKGFLAAKNSVQIRSDSSFDLIVKMLECIYPQGRHYTIMRHSRRFKQARRKEAVKIIEVACVVGFVSLIIIAILNSCCGSGDQY
jgi:hypothetical protein